MPVGRPVLPGEEPAQPARKAARERFLELGQEAWAVPDEGHFQQMSVSPSGQSIAYVSKQQKLLIAAFAGGQAFDATVWGDAVAPGMGGLGPGKTRKSPRALGQPAWSDDGRYLFYASMEGGLYRYDTQAHLLEPLPFSGWAPVTVPGDSSKLIVRRSRATLKADLPGGSAPPDPSEVVLVDLKTNKVRVLVPECSTLWTPLAVSPDGGRLALSSDHGLAKKQLGEQRLFLLDLAAAVPAPPEPIGSPFTQLGPIWWAKNGKALVSSHPLPHAPPDHLEVGESGFLVLDDVVHHDLATGRELLLGRGIALVSAPPGEDLFVVGWTDNPPPGRPQTHVRRVPLAAALEFASKEPDHPTRDVMAWTQFLDQVLADAKVPADATGEQLSPEALARLADEFAKVFRERFQEDPPSSVDNWERLHRELRALGAPKPLHHRLTLVLGAAEGEHLRRRHGAVWRLSAGPLTKTAEPAAKHADTEPFGLSLNPFKASQEQYRIDDEDDSGPLAFFWLRDALQSARGRALILANDPVVGEEAVKALADPDLANAAGLFEAKQSNEAEQVLLALLQQKKYERNEYLVLHVARMFCEQQRFAAARRLLEPRVKGASDPHLYNLLGLALLDADLSAAITCFKDSLRFNIYYDPGYLNLARAYEKAKDPIAAEQTLRRYLRLMPLGEHAADARQRLGALSSLGALPDEAPGP
jgi:hypothetical protein